MVFTDGAWEHSEAGIAAIVISPEGHKIKHSARLEFDSMNNSAEYEAVLLGLRKIRSLGPKKAILKTDSQLVALQTDKSYQAHDLEMKKYLEIIRAYEQRFKGFSIQHVPRTENAKADELAKMAAQESKMPPEIFFEVLTKSAIDGVRMISAIHEEDWREQIEAYLRRESNPREGSK